MSQYRTLTREEETQRGVHPKWAVYYEYVDDPKWGAQFGDTTSQVFDQYSLDLFSRSAPKGWEIRDVRRIYVPINKIVLDIPS